MRMVLIAGSALAMMAAGPAGAQRMVAHGPGAGYPMPSRQPMMMHQGGHAPMMRHGNHWGGKTNGRWWAGWRAPGGWGAYHRPDRGWVLPSYWVSPQFYITDWSDYGLGAPPYGYNWTRYYDDAVLIDGRGSVYDSVGDIDWDRYDGGYAYDAGDEGYAPPPVYEERRYEHRDDGVGGAVAGAVVGGVAGNLIAGRGNRLGGTLIGAGVGAAAGYAVDRAEDHHRYAPPPPPPPPGEYGPRRWHDGGPPPPPPPFRHGPPAASWVSPDGGTTVTTTSTGGMYGTGTTVVTVQTAPIVTTTTTEVYETDAVTWRRPAHHVYRKHVWRPKPRPRCTCR